MTARYAFDVGGRDFARLGEPAVDRVTTRVHRDLLQRFFGFHRWRWRRRTYDHERIGADGAQCESVSRERIARALRQRLAITSRRRHELGRHQLGAVDDVHAAALERLQYGFDGLPGRGSLSGRARAAGKDNTDEGQSGFSWTRSWNHARSLPGSRLPVIRNAASWPP